MGPRFPPPESETVSDTACKKNIRIRSRKQRIPDLKACSVILAEAAVVQTNFSSESVLTTSTGSAFFDSALRHIIAATNR